VRIDLTYSVDVDGAYIGFGYPGSPNTNNGAIDEVTGVIGWQPWKIAGRGSMQWNSQVSWLRRAPSSPASTPSSAHAVMFLTQIRYKLP
jgi:hypothetical protein